MADEEHAIDRQTGDDDIFDRHQRLYGHPGDLARMTGTTEAGEPSSALAVIADLQRRVKELEIRADALKMVATRLCAIHADELRKDA